MSPEQLQSSADTLMQKVIGMGNSNTFSQMLDDAVNERLNYNKDLIDSRSSALQEQLALPAVLRAELSKGNILNPLDRESIIAQRRQTAGTNLGAIISSLAARKSNIADIIGRGTTSYQAQIEAAQMAAQLEQQRADRALAAQERARAAAAQAAQLAAMQRMYNPPVPEVTEPTYEIEDVGGGRAGGVETASGLVKQPGGLKQFVFGRDTGRVGSAISNILSPLSTAGRVNQFKNRTSSAPSVFGTAPTTIPSNLVPKKWWE